MYVQIQGGVHIKYSNKSIVPVTQAITPEKKQMFPNTV